MRVNSGAALGVQNLTIANGNAGYGGGGGIYNGGTLTVTHSTFSGNSAISNPGGGIFNDGTLNLTNTILANNTVGPVENDCEPGTLNASGVNLVKDGLCGSSFPAGTDPNLGPLADNGGPTQTFALLLGSPAIDAVPDTSCPPPATDQRGVTRPQDGNGDGSAFCDIGAYELQAMVSFDFSGFFPPVDNPPTVNTVKAGQGVPVKFSLDGDRGLDIFAAGYPASMQIGCSEDMPVNDIEETVTAGASSLSYDPATDTYTYVWKTDKAWADQCRRLTVRLTDGTDHIALFKFK